MKSILFHGFCLELDPETGSKLYSYREGDGGGVESRFHRVEGSPIRPSSRWAGPV